MIRLKIFLKHNFLRNVLFLIFSVHFIVLPSSHLIGQEMDEYLIKSAFLLKIPLFVEWPENASYQINNNDFVLGIIGNDPFKGKLQSIIKSRSIKIKNGNISVKIISKIEEINGLDMLFISNSEKYNLTKILNYINNKPILTLSDTKAFADKGVIINMFIEDGSIKFDINLKRSNDSKIYISSKLLVNANNVIK